MASTQTLLQICISWGWTSSSMIRVNVNWICLVNLLLTCSPRRGEIRFIFMVRPCILMRLHWTFLLDEQIKIMKGLGHYSFSPPYHEIRNTIFNPRSIKRLAHHKDKGYQNTFLYVDIKKEDRVCLRILSTFLILASNLSNITCCWVILVNALMTKKLLI